MESTTHKLRAKGGGCGQHEIVWGMRGVTYFLVERGGGNTVNARLWGGLRVSLTS
jgi:hypothetical protein